MRFLYYNAKARRPYKSEKFFGQFKRLASPGSVRSLEAHKRSLVLRHFFSWYFGFLRQRRLRALAASVFCGGRNRANAFVSLFSNLEQLLPLVVVRFGWAATWQAALFYIRSGSVFINGRVCRTVSYFVGAGDIVELKNWLNWFNELAGFCPAWWRASRLLGLRHFVVKGWSTRYIIYQRFRVLAQYVARRSKRGKIVEKQGFIYYLG